MTATTTSTAQFTLAQLATALHNAGFTTVAAAGNATPEQARAIVATMQGSEAAKRKDPDYLSRYVKRVAGWLVSADHSAVNKELAALVYAEKQATLRDPRTEKEVRALESETLPLGAAMAKLGCWSADNAPDGTTSVKLVALVTGQTLREEEAVSTVRGWLGGLPSGELRRLKIDLAIAKKQSAETSAKGAKVIPITSAKGAKKEEKTEERPALASMGDNRPKGLVFAAIYDCLHREDGASKEEIRKELRKLERKGVSTMELMESTLRTQLSRMGKERGFEITRTEVDGRGRVYRAVYANRCAA